MKKAFGIAALAFVLGGGVAVAQQPGHHNMPMLAPSQQPASGTCGAEDLAKPGGMSGCGGCQMMRGMMSSGHSGPMMTPAPSDSPRMIQMRGEMMRAMGDVMVKYGKMMESAK